MLSALIRPDVYLDFGAEKRSKGAPQT